MRFEGFDPRALNFLKSLVRHNDKDWFDPRKDQFETLLKAPLVALVSDLGARLAETFPHIIFDPKKSPLRIYRDVRFTNDKSPYKAYVGAHFKNRRSKAKDESPTFYLHIEPGRVFVNGGVHTPTNNQLAQFREFVTRHSARFEAVVGSPQFRQRFGTIQGERLSRAPKGFAPDHPMIEALKCKQLLVTTTFDDGAVTKATFAEKVAAALTPMKPFTDMLDHVFALW